MSIESEITRLQGVKSDILAAIEAKDVIVPPGAALADCPALIAAITSGGGGGATLGDVHLQACVPVGGGIKVVDKNGYIGGNFYGAYYPQSYNFYNNFVIVDEKADFSNTELGQVTLLTPGEDEIGGNTYRTVTIGSQTWLAENLDFKFSGCNIGGSGTPSTPNAWYYNNNEATYGWKGKKYGLLYNWYAVKLLNDNRSTLIPGWHVPSTTEWDALANAVGGKSTAGTVLKSTTDWTSGAGTDVYGFTALPSGYYYGNFDYLGSYACFWTSTENDSNFASYRRLATGTSLEPINLNKTYGCSVRLVKDS